MQVTAKGQEKKVQVATNLNGVIVTDNDVLVRSVIRSVLLHAQQNVFLGRDGYEAVNLARNISGCLILMDIHMPRMDGFEACKAIRKLHGYSVSPIILMTFDDRAQTLKKAMQCGANHILVKPLDPENLLHMLASYTI